MKGVLIVAVLVASAAAQDASNTTTLSSNASTTTSATDNFNTSSASSGTTGAFDNTTFNSTQENSTDYDEYIIVVELGDPWSYFRSMHRAIDHIFSYYFSPLYSNWGSRPAAAAMTSRSALLLLLALAPLAAAFPMDDYAAETDSYALARDAAAGEDYFPALAEPAEGEFEYERPPAPLPAIVYFAEAPSLAQAPAGPRPLGPSKLANKVSEGPLAPRRAPPPPPPPPPARLVPALVLLLPSRDAAEPARFQQLPAAAQDELPPQPWPYLQAPASRGPAPPFLDAPDAADAADAPADQEVPVPDTEVRPPPMPESLYAVAAAQSETGSDESHESEESKDAPSPKTSSAEDDAEATPAPPASTLSPPRTRRSPGGGSSASSNSKSSASSSSGGAGASSFSSASSHSSASSGFGEPIFFGGPTNGDSYASSSSQSNAQAGGAGGAGDAAGYGPGFGAGAPSFGAPGAGGYGNYGAGYNPQGGAGAGFGGQGGQGGHAGPAYGGDGNLLNRFGSLDEPAPSSVQHSGTSTGKGVHSSASSSIDSTGKVTYHVQAGKF